jgi:hypothetical protein
VGSLWHYLTLIPPHSSHNPTTPKGQRQPYFGQIIPPMVGIGHHHASSAVIFKASGLGGAGNMGINWVGSTPPGQTSECWTVSQQRSIPENVQSSHPLHQLTTTLHADYRAPRMHDKAPNMAERVLFSLLLAVSLVVFCLALCQLRRAFDARSHIRQPRCWRVRLNIMQFRGIDSCPSLVSSAPPSLTVRLAVTALAMAVFSAISGPRLVSPPFPRSRMLGMLPFVACKSCDIDHLCYGADEGIATANSTYDFKHAGIWAMVTVIT